MTKKIYAYGMDGLITPMVKYFVKEGSLPNFECLFTQGTVNQTLPSFPVWTPTNWATLSTGAHTGSHCLTQTRRLFAGSMGRPMRRYCERLGYIHAADVVPTFCHILDVEPPGQAQGTIARDLFEGFEMVRSRE